MTPLAHDLVQEMVMGESEPSWYDILTFLGTHLIIYVFLECRALVEDIQFAFFKLCNMLVSFVRRYIDKQIGLASSHLKEGKTLFCPGDLYKIGETCTNALSRTGGFSPLGNVSNVH